MATATKNPEQRLKTVESSSTSKNVEKDIKPFQQFLTKFNNDWSFNLAGALAYNFLLSTFPIIVALLAILGFILGSQHTATIVGSVGQALPSSVNAAAVIKGVQTNLNNSKGILLIISIVSAIIFGSRLFVVIEGMFCIVYHVRPRKLVPQNLMALGMLIAFIIYVPVAFLASSITSILSAFLKSIPGGSFLYTVVGILVSIGVSFLLFLLIYVVVPNQRITLKHSWLGALIAAIALQIYLSLFPLYVSTSLKGIAGAVGATVILIVFFYYFAIILFLGAEVNAYFSEKVQPLPNDLATFTSTMAGRLNKDRPDVEADHIDAKPTDYSDDTHIAESRQNGGRVRGNDARGQSRGREKRHNQRNRKQQVETPQPLASEYIEATAKAKEKASKGPSPAITVFEIVAGSALTLVIEWLRLRRRAR